MRLDLKHIKEITTGAVRVTEEENGFNFYRFTSRQEELYKNRSDDYYKKTFSTSGVQLAFKTDSERLFLKASVFEGSSRKYVAFDVFVNGKKIDSLNNFYNVELPRMYVDIPLPVGDVEKEFALGTGNKEVCVYLPWSVKTTIRELVIDDGAFIEPIKPKYKLLCFGDSITQGYDALFPSDKYTSRLARYLNAQEYNKAIGGEIFFPELATEKEDFVPDYITVAYGTNDWSRCTEEQFRNNCEAFFINLNASYPHSKIFVLTPIWRKDIDVPRTFGSFEKIGEIIKSAAGKYENTVVISGFDFVEHDERFYADLRLHPNDEGFEQYFNNLVKYI